jgi:hypothetical protein
MGINLKQPALEEYLHLVFKGALNSGRKTGFFIGSTRKYSPDSYQLTPIRQSSLLLAGSALVSSAEQAEQLTVLLDGRVDFIFVDSEKKIPESAWGSADAGNIEISVRKFCKRSKIITYKANDLAVQAIDKFVAEMCNGFAKGIGGTQVAILGLGNIGSKVALALVERGANVRCYRRNPIALEGIVAGLNAIKPSETLAKIMACRSALEATLGADIVIGLTPGTPVVTKEVVSGMRAGGFVLDGGRGTVSEEAIVLALERGIMAFRGDVQTVISGEIDNLLRVHTLVGGGFTRRTVGGLEIVSSGLLAKRGEVVVDNAERPRQIFGIADGAGDLLPGEKGQEQKYLELIAESLNGKDES